jgi:hypothetical protein
MGETTTWFRIQFEKIQPVEVVASTDKTVTVRTYWRNNLSVAPQARDLKRHKFTGFECYFPTWQEAHAHLLKEAEGNLLAARRSLETAQSAYGNVKGMKPPKEPTP